MPEACIAARGFSTSAWLPFKAGGASWTPQGIQQRPLASSQRYQWHPPPVNCSPLRSSLPQQWAPIAPTSASELGWWWGGGGPRVGKRAGSCRRPLEMMPEHGVASQRPDAPDDSVLRWKDCSSSVRKHHSLSGLEHARC